MKSKKNQVSLGGGRAEFKPGDRVKFTDEDGVSVHHVIVVEGPYPYKFGMENGKNPYEQAYSIRHANGPVKIIQAKYLTLSPEPPTLLEASKRILSQIDSQLRQGHRVGLGDLTLQEFRDAVNSADVNRRYDR